jgi:polyphosphate kinase
MVRREADHARAGRRARIVVKANALEDPGLVKELYRASMAGVDVDLVIRDICRLRPGLEGLSETVDVHSIVDRFLEHSRIFYFENGGDPEYYVGSADWMTRNLDSRVEAVTPVTDPAIRQQLRFVLDLCLQDNRSVWTMNADGTYDQRRPGDDPVVCTQDVLMDRARAAHESGDDRGIVPTHPDVETSLLLGDGADGADDSFDEVTGTGTTGSRNPPAGGTGAAADGDGVSGAGAEVEVEFEVDTGPGDDNDDPDDDDADATPHPDLPTVLADHPDRWYVPESDRYRFAVRTPDGDREYRKTAEAAAGLVERYWA